MAMILSISILNGFESRVINKIIGLFINTIEDLELKMILGKSEDSQGAIITIHPGAGGTESQDWAEMLTRMYIRWAEKKEAKVLLLQETRGEEAGIKSTTIKIEKGYAYGWLKRESGIHRLVRISPFDSNAKRHTSFASVFVYGSFSAGDYLQLLAASAWTIANIFSFFRPQ